MVKETTEGTMLLGSFLTWIGARLAALILLVVSLALAPRLDVSIESGIKIVVVLGLLLFSTQLAYGRSDDNGIHYRRYFTSVFVPWHGIVSITQESRFAMAIVVEKRGFLTRKLLFLAGPNPKGLMQRPEAFPKLRHLWLEGRRV